MKKSELISSIINNKGN